MGASVQLLQAFALLACLQDEAHSHWQVYVWSASICKLVVTCHSSESHCFVCLFLADGKGAAAAASGAEPDAALAAVLAEAEGEVGPPEGEEALQERLGQLDLLLTWLWRVHGLDYYGGRELLLEAEYADRAAAARTVRGPRPEEGEEQDEEEGEAGCCCWG